jgi:hypothetical protein
MRRKRGYVAVGHIYRITFPNGKIYIGQDRTDDICYFGSACRQVLTADFTREQRRDFTIRKEILVELRPTTVKELLALERAWIERSRSNDPAIGYNRTRHRGGAL